MRNQSHDKGAEKPDSLDWMPFAARVHVVPVSLRGMIPLPSIHYR